MMCGGPEGPTKPGGLNPEDDAGSAGAAGPCAVGAGGGALAFSAESFIRYINPSTICVCISPENEAMVNATSNVTRNSATTKNFIKLGRFRTRFPNALANNLL